MYKIDLPVDQKEAAAINKRRCNEQLRQSRIFNSKARQIGIDTQALEQQVKDKKEREYLEKRTELAYISDAIRNDKIAVLMEKRQKEDIRELSRALNEFRVMHQQPETRREWDLYDPDRLKKDKPARVCDDDPRCGMASLQKFEGEDLTGKMRYKQQHEQLKNCYDQQIADKKRAEDAEKEANRLHDLKRRELDERACELAAAEEACRRAMNTALRHYNEALANEMAERQRLKRQQEDDDARTAISNALYSDLLTENPDQAISSLGPGHVVASRYKGMTPDEVKKVGRLQEDQMKEKKHREDEQEKCDREWDRQRFAQARAALVLEAEESRKRREWNRQLALDNLRIAKEQQAHQIFLDKEVYTNQPTAAYFTQFNTTSR